MTEAKPVAAKQQTQKKKTQTLERTLRASVDDVWAMWTTKDGLESWWGPDGFVVKVRKLDVRVGGELHYAMIAVAPQMVEYMKKAGMLTTTESRITYHDIVPHRRLRYTHVMDFVPGVAAYDVETQVDIAVHADGVHLTLTLDEMHDAAWTKRMSMGWESELENLAASLAGKSVKQSGAGSVGD